MSSTSGSPRARTVLLGAASAALLLLLAAPTPAASLGTLRAAGTAGDPTAPLVAVVALLAWLLAGWLLLTVAVTAGGHLPGRVGPVLAALARRVAPAVVRHAVEAAVGLTAVGVLAASPASASPAASPAGPPGPAAPAALSLDWAAPAPAPDRSADDAQDLDWSATPAAPAAAAPPAVTAVVVQPGDSLWALAEQDLAARGASTADGAVARVWPTWWAANRDVVGDDPDLLLPGARLSPPAAGSTPPASS